MRQTTNQPSLQPCFAIVNSSSNQPPIDLLECKTSHFCYQLHRSQKPEIPAIGYWKRTLQPEPVFDWETIYSPLVSNKQGDINWKIVHKVLPTTLSLQIIGILNSADYGHRCRMTDTIEHAFLDCFTIRNFWNFV